MTPYEERKKSPVYPTLTAAQRRKEKRRIFLTNCGLLAITAVGVTGWLLDPDHAKFCMFLTFGGVIAYALHEFLCGEHG